MNGREVRTAHQARQILGISETADLETMRRAYRAAVRTAHPDRGGDAEILRRVIDAHRLLTDLHKAGLHLAPACVGEPTRRPSRASAKTSKVADQQVWPLEIDISQAIRGGEKSIRLPDGRTGKLRLPAGLRVGDQVRLADDALLLEVSYAAGDLEVHGDDVWMSVSAPARVLREGGSIELETPGGRRKVVVTPDAQVLRLLGQGLPARGGHSQGHLFIRLVAEAEPPKNRARDLLRRFTSAWAA